jgi:hypothetical protein
MIHKAAINDRFTNFVHAFCLEALTSFDCWTLVGAAENTKSVSLVCFEQYPLDR